MSDAQCSFSPFTEPCPTSSQLVILEEKKIPNSKSQRRPNLLTSPPLQTEHDDVRNGVFHWPVWVHCSGYAPSQLPVPPAYWPDMGS